MEELVVVIVPTEPVAVTPVSSLPDVTVPTEPVAETPESSLATKYCVENGAAEKADKPNIIAAP
jgi:hypothetical protein